MRREKIDTLWQGFMTGLIGYATTALFVGAMDLLHGRSFFYTASLLGEHVFYKLRDPSDVVVWPGAVFAYNGLHMLIFLVIGVIAAWLAFMSDKGPELWYAALVLYVLVLLHAVGGILVLTADVRSGVSESTLLIPTLVAATAMTGYLLWARPSLREDMRRWHDEERDATPAAHA